MIRILIVDDQQTIRESIKFILDAESHFEVVGFATNGYEAIRQAAILEPDIILMDLEMPHLNGLAATKLICQQNPDLNIIILTIQDRDELLIQALNAGAKGYLLKGTNGEEIINTIDLICKGSELIKQNSKHSEARLRINSNGSGQPQAIASIDLKDSFSPGEEPNVEKIQKTRTIHLEPYQTQPDIATSQDNNINFSALLAILKRRHPPALMGFAGVIVGAVLYLFFAPRIYTADASIILEDRQESVSELGKNLSSIPGSNEYSPLASQAKLIESIPVIKTALENLVQKNEAYLTRQISPEEIQEIQENLDINVFPNTNILEVSYANRNPEFAALVLNEVIDSVIARNTEIIRSEASAVRQFLEKKVQQQRDELRAAETSENRYREQKGIVALDSQTSNLVNGLNDLETQEQNLLTQIEEQKGIVNSLQQIAKVENADSAYTKSRIGQDQQLERLRTELTNVEAELAAARTNFTDSSPIVISLLEKRDNILNLYQRQVSQVLGEGATVSPSEVIENGLSQTEEGPTQDVLGELITNEAQLKAARDKLQAVRAEKAKLSKRISSLPDDAQSLTELVRQREGASENLQFLRRKLEEARVAEAQLVSNIQIVELASAPSSPSSPKIPLVMAIASVVGIILAAAIILLLETIDRTLYDGKKVERQLHIPLLAALPSMPDSTENLQQIQSFLQNRALYEPYRTLLKRLESCSQQKLQVIVVTSAIAGEGKSVVASHLGAVAAMLSKRTLIIDGHLLEPRQHNWFGVQGRSGLAEIVTDRFSLAKAVQPTKIKNLSLLTSGVLTSNTYTILESPTIKTILQEASRQYDLVIIDAPPVNSNCDAYTLSKYSGGLIMVTRPFHTDKNALEQAVVDLKRDRAPIIGFVINNAEEQKPQLENDCDIKRKLVLLPGSAQTNSSHQNTKEVR